MLRNTSRTWENMLRTCWELGGTLQSPLLSFLSESLRLIDRLGLLTLFKHYIFKLIIILLCLQLLSLIIQIKTFNIQPTLRWILLLFLIYFHPFFYYQCNPIQFMSTLSLLAYTRRQSIFFYYHVWRTKPCVTFQVQNSNFRINERLYYFMQNIVCGMYRLLLLQCSMRLFYQEMNGHVWANEHGH
jgi:hypothetical protein